MTFQTRRISLSPRWANLILPLSSIVALLAALWIADPLGWRQARGNANDAAPPIQSAQNEIVTLQGLVLQDPKNMTAKVQLATAYLQIVRETGDPSYYNKADALLQQALAANPQDFSALVQMGVLALARHDFHAALDQGNKAIAANPDNRLAYGVIGDAQVELGQYDAASASLNKMMTMRPEQSSYARISYLRELNGDIPGAMEAMTAATRAGLENAEGTNWSRVQLGNLYFNSGRLDDAEKEYASALFFYPNYLHALAGLGKVNAARGDYALAIEYYQKALRQIPIPEYVIALGDVFAAAGKPQEAKREYDLVSAIRQLYQANGVDMDMEIALFNADHGIDPAGTVQQAREALARRPSIHAADVLAWALYQVGDYREAQGLSQQALRLGTHDALKLFHAGMISYRLGDNAGARTYLQRALDTNPYFSILYSDMAKKTLKTLQ